LDIRFVLVAIGAKGDGGRTISDFTGMSANRVRAIIRRVSTKSPGPYQGAEQQYHRRAFTCGAGSRNVSVSQIFDN
jgi:hypothetical protein